MNAPMEPNNSGLIDYDRFLLYRIVTDRAVCAVYVDNATGRIVEIAPYFRRLARASYDSWPVFVDRLPRGATIERVGMRPE